MDAPAVPDAVRVYHDPLVLRHDTGPFHPEQPGRVEACAAALAAAGHRLHAPPSPERTLEAISRVHPAGYVERLRQAAARAPAGAGERAFTLFDSPDNPLGAATFDAAVRAVGLTLAAVDDVLAGRARSGFVVVRPPGHHARARSAMGFCFLNTVAVAARDLLAARGLARVLVADFDVHHGNGTQELFWEDGGVAYLSVHRYPFYPGTGASDEAGAGAGRGLTVNVPRPAGSGDDPYAGGFSDALEALAERFRPEMVLVSAGFDAHGEDPLGGMAVTEEGFARMTRTLAEVARLWAGGRLVSVLEGGYDPGAVGRSAVRHVSELGGCPGAIDTPESQP
ncbi:MAG: histone deacetylase [Acidobacteria bacterium]|nr:MAG: histone deacetylase [Acidobacteriota bacterium]